MENINYASDFDDLDLKIMNVQDKVKLNIYNYLIIIDKFLTSIFLNFNRISEFVYIYLKSQTNYPPNFHKDRNLKRFE